MAEKSAGMRSSLSADDVGKPFKKPGKISADFLAQFESDPVLSGSNSSLQFPHVTPGHGSSSDMASTSASHEHLAPARRPNVRISEPPHSSNEDIATGMEHDTEYDGKPEKKRKSIWKWGPLKKVRKFFSRKKHSRRAKSCEDLPVSSTGFKPIGSQEKLTVDESHRYRTTSTPMHYNADVHSKSSPVMRSRSMPPQSPNTVLREAKKRQASSHEEIREAERSPQPVSKTYSLPTLHSPGIRSLRDLYTDEAAVSFESDPNASSIEGLQAAHDKIKAAPKKRRPPTRARSRTSSLGVGDTPVTQDPKAHKRSRTDPKDLTRERASSGNRLDSSSLSDILNNTIFETSELGEEEEGQAVTSQPETSQRDKEQQDSVIDDVMSRVNNILSQTSGPSRLSQSGSPSTKLRAAKVDLKNTAETTEKKVLSVSEKRRSLPNRKTVDNEGSDLDRLLKGMSEERELTMAEKRRSFPEKTTVEEGAKKKELTVAEKRRSFTDKKKDEKPENLESSKTPKESFEKKESTAQEKRKSFTEQKSQESTEKTEKTVSRFPKKESVSSFADSIRSSRAETEVVMAENTCQFESEVTFEDFEFDKLLDNEPTTSKQSNDDNKKESKGSPKKQEQQQKDGIKPAVPFKRGKSWSNNYEPKLQEFPFKLDSTEPSPVKKEAQTNVLSENRELVQQEQVIQKKENKSDTPEESVSFQFSRTKSWSYGTKPGDVRKANAKENQAPAVENEKDEPAWVASAKQKSRRMSQLLQDDETSENQTPTLVKPNKNNINKPPDSKPQTSPKPTIDKTHAKPDVMFEKQPLKAPVRPSKPPVATKEQVKPSTHENPNKPFVIVKDKGQLKASSLYGRSSATLPARTDKNITGKNAVGKTNTRQSLNLSSNETAANKKPFGGVKIDKCIICGTTVYQMEKCKFDDSVLHRNCIKCSVCKRHLTVGNFVMAESKIYCKPHSHIVTVGST